MTGSGILLLATHVVIAALIFVLVEWLLPILAGLLGIGIPSNVVIVIALLLALLYLAGGYVGGWYRRGPVA